MRNLFARLRIRPDAPDEAVADALDRLPPSEEEFADETAAVLLDPVRREQYDRVHLQYEAAVAMRQAAAEHTLDTHQWERRLIEFEDV